MSFPVRQWTVASPENLEFLAKWHLVRLVESHSDILVGSDLQKAVRLTSLCSQFPKLYTVQAFTDLKRTVSETVAFS